MIIHAGLIARRVGGFWLGVLIEGAAGSGKSDLALRALSAGFALIADDRVVAFVSGHRLYGRAPDVLGGLIEARGLGVVSRPAMSFARIALRVRCVGGPDAVERLGAPALTSLLGIDLPTADVWPFEPSAPLKLAATLQHLGAGAQQGYQPPFAPRHERADDQRGRP